MSMRVEERAKKVMLRKAKLPNKNAQLEYLLLKMVNVFDIMFLYISKRLIQILKLKRGFNQSADRFWTGKLAGVTQR